MTYSFIKAEGDVSVSSVKADEKTGKDIIVRLYNPTNDPCGCTAKVNGNEVTVPVKAGAFETLILKF